MSDTPLTPTNAERLVELERQMAVLWASKAPEGDEYREARQQQVNDLRAQMKDLMPSDQRDKLEAMEKASGYLLEKKIPFMLFADNGQVLAGNPQGGFWIYMKLDYEGTTQEQACRLAAACNRTMMAKCSQLMLGCTNVMLSPEGHPIMGYCEGRLIQPPSES